jgi:hypothetical protein
MYCLVLCVCVCVFVCASRYFKQQEITLWRKAIDSLEEHAQPKSMLKYKEDEVQQPTAVDE